MNDPVITTDELWAAVDAALGTVSTERPAGAFTSVEYAQRNKLSRSTARDRLIAGVDSGVLKTCWVQTVNAAGRMSPQRVYWLVAKP